MNAGKQSRRPSSRKIDKEKLELDLVEFKRKALELGASAAEIIPASHVVIEERVWLKCLVPRCPIACERGTPNCPPNTPTPDFMRKVISQYQRAILFKRDIEHLEDHMSPPQHSRRGKPSYHEKTWEILGQLESYIQSKSYDLALGFSGGNCKMDLCHGADCGFIRDGTCRQPFRARPSMEAVGIDVVDLVNKVGWEIYMIRNTEPDISVIPHAISVGIIFVC